MTCFPSRLAFIPEPLVRPLQFRVQLRVQEIVIRIAPAERMFPQQRRSRRSLARVDRETVQHERHRLGTDTAIDVVRDRRGLVEGPEFVDGADGFLLAPRLPISPPTLPPNFSIALNPPCILLP